MPRTEEILRLVSGLLWSFIGSESNHLWLEFMLRAGRSMVKPSLTPETTKVRERVLSCSYHHVFKGKKEHCCTSSGESSILLGGQTLTGLSRGVVTPWARYPSQWDKGSRWLEHLTDSWRHSLGVWDSLGDTGGRVLWDSTRCTVGCLEEELKVEKQRDLVELWQPHLCYVLTSST